MDAQTVTTTTTPAEVEARKVMEARWQAITWQPHQFEGDGLGWSPVPTKLGLRLDRTIEQLGRGLVFQGTEDDGEKLQNIVEELGEIIRDRLIAFALDVRAAQEARTAAAAA